MTLPAPKPGLVVRYAYLWEREAATGREEASKDRPCAVILAVLDEQQRTIAYVLPITHVQPSGPDEGIEIPQVVKDRLGLDSDKSWIVISEVNVFVWPGPDLRMRSGQGPASVAYGFLPPAFFKRVRDRFVERARRKKATIVPRGK